MQRTLIIQKIIGSFFLLGSFVTTIHADEMPPLATNMNTTINTASTNNNSNIATANQEAAIISPISGQSIQDTYVLSELSPTSFAKLNVDQQKSIADSWHLSVEDYAHYLALMANTPNGWYYKDKNLDPSWVLGFNAEDDKTREKYVVIAIQNERLRIAKELAFQKDFDRLQRELYPNLAPVLWSSDDNTALKTNNNSKN